MFEYNYAVFDLEIYSFIILFLSETPNEGGGDGNELRPMNGEVEFELADISEMSGCINLDQDMNEGNLSIEPRS